eukprot:COSAG02_NODE_26353_length_635_cov_0.682836_1_plen_47_part_01
MYFKLLTYSPREYCVPLKFNTKHVAQNTYTVQHVSASVSNHPADATQ